MNKKLVIPLKTHSKFLTQVNANAGSKKKRKSSQKCLKGSDDALDSSITNSIYDSNVRMANSLHFKKGDQNAGKIWELGKTMGVTSQGDELVVIKKIAELEERDTIGFINSNQGDQGGYQ
ncbi:unnamed protein product [Lupinus luteus]|uniref:Uncharacterized protein n=1 Tax=Lupinus luteus TaxID=3873 RepID=A0AAV1W7J6_LUPLU